MKSALPFLKTAADGCVDLAMLKCRPDIAAICKVVSDIAPVVQVLANEPTPTECKATP